MNNCCFTGFLTENPHTEIVNDILVAEFVVVVYNYRTAKSTGEKTKIPTYIHCEAWHTGAEILERNAKKGTKITFSSTAKNASKNDDYIIFRINEFDLCNEGMEE
jgi:single-stranded DNA-binding protein